MLPAADSLATASRQGTWSLCHQLGLVQGAWTTSTLTIVECLDTCRFVGEIRGDYPSAGLCPSRVTGSFFGVYVAWQAVSARSHLDVSSSRGSGILYFSGRLGDDCQQIRCGRILSASHVREEPVLCATFTARRISLPTCTLSQNCAMFASTHVFITLSEAVLDEFDLHGVGTETLRIWRDYEDSAVSSLPRSRSRLMPSMRDQLIRQMASVLYAAGAIDRWLCAVSLLDMCSHGSGSVTFIEDLPWVCAAIIRLVQRFHSRSAPVCRTDVIQYALTTAECLYDAGHVIAVPQYVTGGFIHHHEKVLLAHLRYLAYFPTAAEWLSVLFARFQILTQGQYDARYVADARSHAELLVQMCVLMLDTCEPSMKPSRIARGLFVHSLVAVRLFPLKLLQPPSLDFQEWVILFGASQIRKPESFSHCVLSPHRIAVLVGYIETSSDVDFAALREDNYYLAVFLRDAFKTLRSLRVVHASPHMWE
jgi:hypothetical protein